MKDYIVCIDIGSSKISGSIAINIGHGSLEVVGVITVESKGIKKGSIVDIDAASESINSCVEQLKRIIDIDITKVYISFKGLISELLETKGVVAISSEDREVKYQDIERVKNASKIVQISSDKEIVGIIPHNYTLDSNENIKDPLGMSGLRLELDAQIAIGRSTAINNVYKAVNKCNLKVKGILLQPLVLNEVLLREQDMQRGVLIVDTGAETTEVSVFKEGKLLNNFIIPVGGDHITKDLAICLKLPGSKAENLKLQYGELYVNREEYMDNIEVKDDLGNKIMVSKDMLYDIIEARVEELIFMIRDKLLMNGYLDVIDGAIFTGGGIALLNNCAQFATKILSMPVRIGYSNYVGANSPMYSSVIGMLYFVNNNTKVYKKEKEEVAMDNFELHEEVEKERGSHEGLLTKIKDFISDFF